MLKEMDNVYQNEEGINRRWFQDSYFDLITWDRDEVVIGFQLCYDRSGMEKSLTWKKDKGFTHDSVDDGQVTLGMDMSAILVEDGPVPIDMLINRFTDDSREIDSEIRQLVLEKLNEVKKDPS